jgi:O-antigen ligase
VIRWQPGYVYPPVFYPPHPALDAVSALVFALVAIGVGIVALRRPANGVAALIGCTPFADAHYFANTSVTIPKAALAGFIVALIGRRCSTAIVREAPVARLLAALGIVITVMLLSAIGAEYKDAVAREIGKWLEYAAILVAVAVAFSSDPDDRPIWVALSATVAVVSLLAIAQEFIGAPSGLFVHAHSVPRIAGPLEGPNQLSAWLGVAIPVLLARMLVHRDGRLVGVTVLAAIADALSLSRSGVIAVIVGCAVVVVATRPPARVRWRFAAGTLAVIAVLVVLGVAIGLESRFFSLAEIPQRDHLGTRGVLWKAALDLWRSSPIVGIGAGNYELALGRVGLTDVRTHANSLYLQSLAETGIVGFCAMLYLVYVSIQTFARGASRRPLVIGALAASVALALHQIFDYLVFFPKVGSLWWIVLAVGAVELVQSRADARVVEAPG